MRKNAVFHRAKQWFFTPFMGVSFLAIFAFVYFTASKNNFNLQAMNNVIFLSQLFCDAFIGYFSFKRFMENRKTNKSFFYQAIFMSILIGLGANETYNIVVNFFGVFGLDNTISLGWIVPYTLFLICQLIAWGSLLIKKNHSENQPKINKFIIFAYMQSWVVLVLSIFMSNVTDILRATPITYFEVLNTFLELSLLVMLSICLAKTKSKAISYLATGFLLLISFNLAQRVCYMTSAYYQLFNIVWLISLVIIIFGLSEKYGKYDEKIEFFHNSSIHVFSGAIFVLFSSVIFFIFLLITFFLVVLDSNGITSINFFDRNIPPALVFSYTFSILLSKFVASLLSGPLDDLSKKINLIQDKKMGEVLTRDKKRCFYEMSNLEDFVMRTISQLEAANEIKSNFIMSMSHDLRTPASGIYHLSKVIYEKINSDSLIKNLQKMIVDSSAQLMNLIDGILDCSQFYNENFERVLELFNVTNVVNDLIAFMLPKLTEKNLAVKVDILLQEDCYIGYRLLLNRILLNLVSNAVKFTEVGDISIIVSDEMIDGTLYIRFNIKDSGIGIDQKYHQLIFEPFYRVSPSGDATGVGLGLSNVNVILKKIGGKIQINSQVGIGSSFTILFPVLNK